MAAAAEYYRDLVLAHLPPRGYDTGAGSVVHAIAAGLGTILARAEQATDQLALEVVPQTSEECLGEWEELLQSPYPAGATIEERQAALTAVWRLALGPTLCGLRSILGPLLRPTHLFWDRCNDQDVSYRYDLETGNGAVLELATGLAPRALSGADCRPGLGNNPRALIPLADREDTAVLECRLVSWTNAIDCGGGVGFWADYKNAILYGPENNAGTAQLVARLVLDNVWYENRIALPALPIWLRVSHDGHGRYVYEYGATLGAMTQQHQDADVSFVPHRAVMTAWNAAPGYSLSEIVLEEVRLSHGQQHNNVEIVELPLSVIPAMVPERKFFFFVHRDPADNNTYDWRTAQRVLDRAKSGHTLGLVGESDCFLCDDPYSLTDRDILGS